MNNCATMRSMRRITFTKPIRVRSSAPMTAEPKRRPSNRIFTAARSAARSFVIVIFSSAVMKAFSSDD
jgi:hypothetical protein